MTSILLLYENRLYEITAGKFDKQILCRRYFAHLVLSLLFHKEMILIIF